MKYWICAFWSSVFSVSGHTQFQIGSESTTSYSPNPVIGKYLDGIDETRTIFVYRNADEDNLDDFKKTLSDSWEINELVFMSYDEFSDYKIKEGECYLTISTNYMEITGSQGSVSHISDFALSFWRYANEHSVFFSYTQLYVPIEANILVINQGIEGSNILEKLYTEIDIRNWNLGFLKATLSDLSNSVKANASRSCGATIIEQELSDLKNDTLYVSDDVLIELHKLQRVEKTTNDTKSYIDTYDYPIAFVSNNEINQKVISGQKNYCLSFIRNSVHKFIVVYETSSGKILYTKMESKPNFSKSDLRDLQQAIENY